MWKHGIYWSFFRGLMIENFEPEFSGLDSFNATLMRHLSVSPITIRRSRKVLYAIPLINVSPPLPTPSVHQGSPSTADSDSPSHDEPVQDFYIFSPVTNYC
ncbi:hypothetical protein E4U55_005907 [Claviceps digitariae]|nr:hypothetical protein E4U55_005907 [Claviceps digitariae]